MSSPKGLSDKQVEESRAENGSNELPPPEVETFLEKLLENFQDPLIKILCVALVITTILALMGYADWVDGVGIAVAVFLATFVATYSEHKNESSFQKLQEEASKIQNKVYRNGQLQTVFVGEIVVGDHVLVEMGDKIPADGKLVEGQIYANQAALTGEPHNVLKRVAPKGYKTEDVQFSDDFIVFRETVCTDGSGILVVDSVGVNTQYGKISEQLGQKESRPSPLQVKLERLADGISFLGYIGAIFIAFSFLFKQFVMDQNYEWDKIVAYVTNWQLALKDGVTALILGIIIIVVAVPEGLPMMIAIVLSLNMRKLLQAKVLVRKLLGIETAGSLNILFTDKTGTLTKGQLETHMFVSGSLHKYYKFAEVSSPLQQILTFAVQNSSAAHVTPTGIIGGNASDRAFVAWVQPKPIVDASAVTRAKNVLFTSDLKFSASEVVVEEAAARSLPRIENYNGGKLKVTLVKGAPEKILGTVKSFYQPDGQIQAFANNEVKLLDEAVTALSHKGMRIVALATSANPLPDTTPATLPSGLTLVGVLAINDEIRPESKEALRMASQAGIQVVMITGDRVETAVAIAKEIDLLPSPGHLDDMEDPHDKFDPNTVLTSTQIHKMSDDQLRAALPKLRVVARALPTDKSRLVKVAQSLNLVVGMTGDGVNDAAALKKSDVGFAIGSGTDVAKEASDIVILDDNFFSIAMSVLYGRTIFRSIRKFIVFQSTINVAATTMAFLGPFMGFDFPLTLIQLLWVNLVMDTLAALAFGGEPALKRYMKDRPISRTEAIISPDMWSSILSAGGFIAVVSIFFLTNDNVYDYFKRPGATEAQTDAVFLTAFFSFFIFMATINAFNVRTPKINILDHLAGNGQFILVIAFIWLVQVVFTYLGGSVLRTVPLLAHEWGLIMGLSFIIIPFDMIRKLVLAPLLPKTLIDHTAEQDKFSKDSDEEEDEERKESEEDYKQKKPKSKGKDKEN